MSELTAARLREVLHYNPETGVFTRLIAHGQVKSGDIVGCPSGSGHLLIRVDGNGYYAYRLAWLYMTGEWPQDHIDHINGDPPDNRWKNLREATPSQNHANRGRNKNNTSGFKGVSLHRKTGKWCASVKVDYKHQHLGLFDTPEEAHEAYMAAAKARWGEFARAA